MRRRLNSSGGLAVDESPDFCYKGAHEPMSKRAAPSKTSPPPPASDKTSLRIEYVDLATLIRAPRNPKGHDLGALHQSLSRFGFVNPILVDDRTGRIVAGHGRLDALQQLKASGGKAPARVHPVNDAWLVPVIRGVDFENDTEAESYLIADNRTVELGGWDDAALASLLSDLAAQDALMGTGFDGEDVDRLIAGLGDSLLGEQGQNGANDAVRVICNVPPRVWLTMPNEVKQVLTAACNPLGIEITWPD